MCDFKKCFLITPVRKLDFFHHLKLLIILLYSLKNIFDIFPYFNFHPKFHLPFLLYPLLAGNTATNSSPVLACVSNDRDYYSLMFCIVSSLILLIQAEWLSPFTIYFIFC